MARLGISGGWTPPPPYILPPGTIEKLRACFGDIPLPSSAVAAFQSAGHSLIEDRRVGAAAATPGQTRDCLEEWRAALYALERCFDRYNGADIDARAAMWLMAAAENSFASVRLPPVGGRMRELQADIEAMAILSERALRDLGMPTKGREPENAVRMWIKTVAEAAEAAGLRTTQDTKRGPRISHPFGRLLRCLEIALPGEVHLPDHKTVMEHARSVLIEMPVRNGS